ncbi:hypothetical protein PCYB_004420, partial [Plasmodium cynomolgi strain B]
YVYSKIDLYDHFEKKCVNEDSRTCPNFYNLCKIYHPKDVLPRINCHNALKDKYILPSAVTIIEKPQSAEGLVSAELTRENTFSNDSPRETANSSPIPSFGNALLGIVATFNDI